MYLQEVFLLCFQGILSHLQDQQKYLTFKWMSMERNQKYLREFHFTPNTAETHPFCWELFAVADGTAQNLTWTSLRIQESTFSISY